MNKGRNKCINMHSITHVPYMPDLPVLLYVILYYGIKYIIQSVLSDTLCYNELYKPHSMLEPGAWLYKLPVDRPLYRNLALQSQENNTS